MRRALRVALRSKLRDAASTVQSGLRPWIRPETLILMLVTYMPLINVVDTLTLRFYAITHVEVGSKQRRSI